MFRKMHRKAWKQYMDIIGRQQKENSKILYIELS